MQSSIIESKVYNPSLTVTVVIPVYKNSSTLHELHQRLKHIFEKQFLSYKVLFINDACPLGSQIILKEITQSDPNVAVLSLDQNIGQHRAVLIGLQYVQSQWVVVMDADLQDPPEAITNLLNKIQEGYTVVFAGRRGRYESRFRHFTSRLFKKLLHLLCGLPSDAGMFLIMNRQMLEYLKVCNYPNPYLVGIIGCANLPLTSIPVKRNMRPFGASAYSTWKRFKVAFLAIASLSRQRFLTAIYKTKAL